MLMSNESDAEDVLQDVLLKYVKKGPGAGGKGAEAWLFKVSRNHAFNAMRGLKRRKARESSEEVSERPAPSVDPSERVIKKEALQRIRDCLVKLPLMLRELVFLRVVENLSFSHLADRTGAPKSTVALKVQEGLILLNRCFHGQGYEDNRR